MDKLLLDALQSIKWGLFLQFAVAAVVLLYLKRYFDSIAAYMMFRSNKDLGKNVRVIVNGEEGFISKVNWRFIYVDLPNGTHTELIIPIVNWSSQRWEICKNGHNHGGKK